MARPDVGGGMLLLAPLKLAVVESRRPTLTSQLGPPSCNQRRHPSVRTHFTQSHTCTVKSLRAASASTTHYDDAVPSSDGEDVSAGDDAGAHLLDGRLDGIDDLEASHGAVVGRRHLLALKAGRVVQQQRRVAALYIYTCMQIIRTFI